MIPNQYKSIMINSITKLVEEHKKNCNEDCGISVFLMGLLVKELQEKELDDEQCKLFI